MQTLLLDYFSLFNRPPCISYGSRDLYIPSQLPVVATAEMHTTHCPTQVVLPRLSHFSPFLSSHFASILLVYICVVFFSPLSSPIPHVFLYSTIFSHLWHTPFSHFIRPWRSYLRHPLLYSPCFCGHLCTVVSTLVSFLSTHACAESC
jgi:hypothetical protein